MPEEEKTLSGKIDAETLCAIPLTKEQTAQLNGDLGVDVSWLLVQRLTGSPARDIDPSYVSLLRVTWCW